MIIQGSMIRNSVQASDIEILKYSLVLTSSQIYLSEVTTSNKTSIRLL